MTDLTTALTDLHHALGARMVPFAGYAMPVQYPEGIIKEHLHTRAHAGLFDVSHMGQVSVTGSEVVAELEALMPADLAGLAVGASTYSLLMNASGGVDDDLIVTRLAETQFLLVVNAACKHQDIARITDACRTSEVIYLDDKALLALQGPAARTVMARLAPETKEMVFMTGRPVSVANIDCYVTCSGYTGEDGFELSCDNTHAIALAQCLLAEAEVAPIGLGARDSLRLEAGLCLYGHELSTDISPIEAGLGWAIARARRPEGARAGGYPGAERVASELASGVSRRRVGLQVAGKRPVREGQSIIDAAGNPVGVISSGGFGPTVGAPVAMGFVTPECAAVDTELQVDVRGTLVPVRVVALPMVPAGYHRG